MNVVFFRRDGKQVSSVLTISFASDVRGRRGITSDDLFRFIFTKTAVSPRELRRRFFSQVLIRTATYLQPRSKCFWLFNSSSFVFSLYF